MARGNCRPYRVVPLAAAGVTLAVAIPTTASSKPRNWRSTVGIVCRCSVCVTVSETRSSPTVPQAKANGAAAEGILPGLAPDVAKYFPGRPVSRSSASTRPTC